MTNGTARFATKAEVRKTYLQVPYTPELWREQKEVSNNLPQGIVVGCNSSKLGTTALVDEGDVHCLMIGAAGVGKTAYFLYPNLEYACASGMSFITSDTKGDLYRQYGHIAKEYYGYDADEGLLTATILLIAEFCEPSKRHIVSVFKMIQDLLAPSRVKGKNQFQLLIERLPPEHKARWFAGAALNTAEQAMSSVMSTALSRLNAFLDSVSRGKNDPSQSLQMIERPLMTPDELKSMPKGQFIVMKTGFYPMIVKLKLFFNWGIKFDKTYELTDKGNRIVSYAGKDELESAIIKAFKTVKYDEQPTSLTDETDASDGITIPMGESNEPHNKKSLKTERKEQKNGQTSNYL